MERADAESSEALRAWSRRGFHQQHLLDLFTQAETDLYVGDMRGAHTRLRAAWADVEGLPAAAHEDEPRDHVRPRRADRPRRRPARPGGAPSLAVALGRAARSSHGAARHALVLRDGSLDPRGRGSFANAPAEAAKLYASAATALDAEGMKLLGAAARMRAGALDPRRRDDAARARARFLEEDVRVPERFATMLAP